MNKKTQPDVEFARFFGEMAEQFSFNKSIGQIYGLLYMSSSALSLPEIADTLNISKGNVSLNIRILEEWGAVTHVSIHGSRRDFYQANMNMKELALKRFQEGIGRRLNSVSDRINVLTTQSTFNAHGLKKINEFKSMLSTSQKFLDSVPKLSFLFRK